MAVSLENLLTLVARLQSDPDRDSRLGSLAAEIGLSPTHLQRIFAKMVGESPKRIALRIALERAAAALVTTPDSILDIALASGFDSHEGFTRAFRRQFDMSPAQYRERGLAGVAPELSELAALHRNTVASVGPCIGLFGARGAQAAPSTSERRKPTMTYDVTKKTLEETPVLFMRRRIDSAQIATALAELLPAVYSYAMKAGIPLVGPPFCRYRQWNAGGVTLEAGLPVAANAQGDGDILAGTLPAGPAAATIHTGPYEQLKDAYAALEKWLAANALKSADDPWEVYITDPGQEPDSAKWQTEVIWPTNE